MFNGPVASRQCVRAILPGTHPLSTTRKTIPPFVPCLVQQRQRTYFSRLLGTGFNSIKSKGRVTKKAVKRTPTPASVARLNASHAPRTQVEQVKNDVPPIQDIIRPPLTSSRYHYDLSTYNRFVSRNKVDKESTTYIGTRYEYVVAEALKSWGMRLHRRGGKDDEGIDLKGDWTPPGTRHDFTVLVQCKFGRPMPAFARELEGSVATARRRAEREEHAVLAVLASPKAVSPATWQTIQRSSRPMCFAQVSAEGQIINFRRNAAADKAGLAGFTQHVIYVPSSDGDGKMKRPRRRVVLSAYDRFLLNQESSSSGLLAVLIIAGGIYWFVQWVRKKAALAAEQKQLEADQQLGNVALKKLSELKEMLTFQETYEQLGGWFWTTTRDEQGQGWLWTMTTCEPVSKDGYAAGDMSAAKDKPAAGDIGLQKMAGCERWLRGVNSLFLGRERYEAFKLHWTQSPATRPQSVPALRFVALHPTAHCRIKRSKSFCSTT